MTDILRRLHCTIRCDIETAESGCHCAEGRDTITALRAEVERRKAGYTATQHDIQQTLGKALGYPWFKDDPTNFPTAIEADGVCVGDHVAESLADEAAAKITALRAKVERLEGALVVWQNAYKTGRNEPLVQAYEHCAALGDTP